MSLLQRCCTEGTEVERLEVLTFDLYLRVLCFCWLFPYKPEPSACVVSYVNVASREKVAAAGFLWRILRLLLGCRRQPAAAPGSHDCVCACGCRFVSACLSCCVTHLSVTQQPRDGCWSDVVFGFFSLQVLRIFVLSLKLTLVSWKPTRISIYISAYEPAKR